MGFFDQHMRHAEHVQPQQPQPAAQPVQPQPIPPQPQPQQQGPITPPTPFPISNEMISCADQIKGQGDYVRRFQTIAYHEEQFKPYPKDNRYYVGTLGTVYDSVNNVKLFPFRVPRGFHPMHYNHYLNYYLDNIPAVGHRMVAETFLPKPEDPEVNTINHKNGIKSDNSVDNLEWVTHKENVDHAYRTGLIHPQVGEDRPAAKLLNKEVESICAMMEAGESNEQIALKFGFTPDMSAATNRDYFNFLRLCHDIRSKIRWKAVSQNYNIGERSTHYHSNNELERICQLICDGLDNSQIVAKIKEEFNHNISEGSVRIVRYCNPKYQPTYWPIVSKYKDKFPSRSMHTFKNEEDVHKVCRMMADGASKSDIAQAVGMENDSKFRALLSRLRNGYIYPEITSKYKFKAEHRRKFTKEDVWKILEYRLLKNLSVAEIAKIMEVDNFVSFRVTVSQLVKGQFFSDVREEFRNKYGI